MTAVVAPEEYYFSTDFRERIFKFRPRLFNCVLGIKEGADPPTRIIFFFGIKSVERLLWFLSFLRSRLNGKEVPIISLAPLGEEAFRGYFLINLPDFPVYKFAKSYRQTRILEKEIEVMDAQVITKVEFQVFDRGFQENFTHMSTCLVKIDSVEPMGFGLEDRSLLELEAEIVFPEYQ